MKTKLALVRHATVLLLFSTINFQLSTAIAQGIAFTYQGRLTDSGSLANGRYDFIFLVFDAASGGSSLGGSVNTNGIGVSNGLFTVALDFGSLPFTGPQRWLQISVSTNGAGTFTTLAPRQEITRAPYATYANTAATVTNGAIANAQLAVNSVGSANIQSNAVSASRIAAGQVVKSLNGLSDAVSLTQGANVTINTVGNSLQISAPAGGMALPFSGTASSTGSIFTLANSGTGPAGVFLGNVGIGTSSPASKLHILSGASDGPARLQSSGTSGFAAGLDFYQGAVGKGYVGVPDAAAGFAPGELMLFSGPDTRVSLWASQARAVTVETNGNVGISTAAPRSKLEVRGDIRMGPTGQYLATGGEENLRIVRGFVYADGSVFSGCCFSVNRISPGLYRIGFDTPFSEPPTVTATVHHVLPSGIAIGTSSINAEAAAIVITLGDERTSRDFQFIAVGPR